MNPDTTENVPPVVIVSAPEPPVLPEPAPEDVLWIDVVMPRVVCEVLIDYHGRQGDWCAGTRLEVDQAIVETVNMELPGPAMVLALVETLETTTLRRYRRLVGQEGERCTWAEYSALRDRLRWEYQEQHARLVATAQSL